MSLSRLRGLASFAAILLLATNAFAHSGNQLSFGPPIKATIHIATNKNSGMSVMQPKQTIDVYLMNFNLTDEQKSHLYAFRELTLDSFTAKPNANTTNKLPSRVQLGMNGVPVLNQGKHGSCVTFAVTAAIDSLIYHGDHISQIALLELGEHLKGVTFWPSGWDGSIAPYVLDRISEYGTVKKASPNEYPLERDFTHKPITPEAYAKLSRNVRDDFIWYPLLTKERRFKLWHPKNISSESVKVLDRVKFILATIPNKASGRDVRIVTGVMLPVNHCGSGACASYHTQNDTFALTSEIFNDPFLLGGAHEMIITGYDDNAVATEDNGKKHKGLLTLRNSWSEFAGNHGDYYMTYDFFRAFIIEAHTIEKDGFLQLH